MTPGDMREYQSSKKNKKCKRPRERTRNVSRKLRIGMTNCTCCWAEDSGDTTTKNPGKQVSVGHPTWKATSIRAHKE